MEPEWAVYSSGMGRNPPEAWLPKNLWIDTGYLIKINYLKGNANVSKNQQN